jgi:hypothetical protein
MLMRRLVSCSAAALLVVSLSACGSSSDGGTTAANGSDPSRSASATPTAATGSALFARMSKATSHAESARTTFTSTVGQQGIRGSGSFRFGDNPAADITVQYPGQGQLRVVLLGRTAYLGLPASVGLPAGKRWVKIDGTGDNPMDKLFGPVLEQLHGSVDPMSNLSLLKGVTTITPAGTEQVDGVSTTKYTASVDLVTAAAQATGPAAQQYKELVGGGARTMRYTLWVDGQNLPRKFATRVPTTVGTVAATGTYTDWGKPVSIPAPKPRQVADSADLGGLGGGATTRS